MVSKTSNHGLNSPEVPDYQDFQIIRCQIIGILEYNENARVVLVYNIKIMF
jgi:hypothetical protein